MADNETKLVENKVDRVTGNEQAIVYIGQGIGCFLLLAGVGVCIALIAWAAQGFPGL